MNSKKLLTPCLVLLLLLSSFAAAEEVSDPLESFNRGVFWFNDQVDIYFFEPVSSGYDYVVPDVVQESVDNFFVNLRSPIYLVSDLVQLKPAQFANHTGRFLINSTLGLAGLFDVAQYFGLEHHYEDFGIALGYHGVSSGAYIVIPLLGPSNVRDAFGRIVDAFLNPTFYASSANISWEQSTAISGGAYFLDSVNTRASLLDAVETAKESSLDYYLFVRSAYGQLRENHIHDLEPEDEFSEEGYDFDDDDLEGEDLEDDNG